MNLYKPNEYPVNIGNGRYSALCTVWDLPDGPITKKSPGGVIQRCPELLSPCSIIGSLYSRDGIAPLIRNLALNPLISTLYVWDHGPLSRNAIGTSATDILRALWRNGIGDDGLIFGTNYRLESEIDPAFVRQIVSDVALFFVGNHELIDLPKVIVDTQPNERRNPQTFPDPIPVKVDRWPIEGIGLTIRAQRLIDVWQELIVRIMRYGVKKGTQYGQQQKELVGCSWIMNDDPDEFKPPSDWPESLLETTGVSLDRLNAYLRQMLTAADGPKTYGAKLLAFPAGNGTIDQVNDVIIRSLTESFDSRRAVATTMNPPDEWNITDPPCLTSIQGLQADGRLNMIAVFRSHDIFRAGLHNAIAVRKLQKHIAGEVCLDLGALMIVSNSAHIYEANWGAAQLLIDCAFLKRKPSAGLRPEQYDPRGNYLIRHRDSTIIATLRSQDAAELIEIEDRRASRIMDRIAQLGLTVDPRHLMYLGAELTKAEIALHAGQPYVQDQD